MKNWLRLVAGILVTTAANGAAFLPGTPSTTCPNSGFANTLAINVPGGGDSFSVTGTVTLLVKAGDLLHA